MYGTLLSNKQIELLIKGPSGFKINPYDRSRQKLAHYKLSPARILAPGPLRKDGTRRHVEIGDLRDGTHVFKPAQYLIVEVKETVILPEGIVGQFTPASTLIEQGFGLVAGKLDSEYGSQGERILLGLVNLLDEENPFDPTLGIGHVSFTDFRGTERNPARFTAEERADFRDRRLRADDGPDYHRDDPEY
jgi:deoxycytidine triphosphate deaminase